VSIFFRSIDQMSFLPVCNHCCSTLDVDAVFTSCNHILCARCTRAKQPNMCPICSHSCHTVAFGGHSFPAWLKERMISDQASDLTKCVEIHQFQQQQEEQTFRRLGEMLCQKDEENLSLERTIAELQNKLAKTRQEINRHKTSSRPPSRRSQERHSSQTTERRSALMGLFCPTEVDPSVPYGVGAGNDIFGMPSSRASPGARSSGWQPRTPLPESPLVSVATPMSGMSVASSAASSHFHRQLSQTSDSLPARGTGASPHFNRPLTAQLLNQSQRSQQPPPLATTTSLRSHGQLPQIDMLAARRQRT